MQVQQAVTTCHGRDLHPCHDMSQPRVGEIILLLDEETLPRGGKLLQGTSSGVNSSMRPTEGTPLQAAKIRVDILEDIRLNQLINANLRYTFGQ